jgi:hypothetical protein
MMGRVRIAAAPRGTLLGFAAAERGRDEIVSQDELGLGDIVERQHGIG